MYSVCVRDHFMIAHSFRGEVFGPAQKLHGATYVVDVEFRRDELNKTLGALNFQNLDEVAEFDGKNTTTEFMARVIFDRMAAAIARGDLGPNASGLTALKVTLHESHVAWAAYEGAL